MKNTSAPLVTTLIKFLKTDKDVNVVEKVLRGNFKMGSVRQFREDYKEEAGLRNDNDEFCDHSFVANQNIDIIIQDKGRQVGNISAIKGRLLSCDHRSYIFSMSAITDCLFSQNKTWCFDQRVRELGDQAVIVTNPHEFMRRINVAIQAESFLLAYPGTNGQASCLMKYIDYKDYNGSIGPFRKSNEYDFQNEWRLALIDSRDNMPSYPDNYFLEVGDLTDISFAVDTDALIQRGFTLEEKAL